MGHGFDTARLDRIPAFLGAKYVESGRLPHAATLVSRRGEIAHLSCIGEARPGEPLKEDAIFRIASMTKPITSIAFMMLLEDGDRQRDVQGTSVSVRVDLGGRRIIKKKKLRRPH